MDKPVGQLKAKKIVQCSICGCSLTKSVSEIVYGKDDTEIQKAKEKIIAKLNTKYTCKICKAITKNQ